MSESETGDRPLPYEVSGHTILKKPSMDHTVSVGTGGSCSSASGAEGDMTPPVLKHTCFRDEVVIIEYDTKCKVLESTDHNVTHTARLYDAVFEDADSHEAIQKFEHLAMNEAIAALGAVSPNLCDGGGSTADAGSTQATGPKHDSSSSTKDEYTNAVNLSDNVDMAGGRVLDDDTRPASKSAENGLDSGTPFTEVNELCGC